MFMKIINPHIVCKNGAKLSIQANESAYCTPRENEGPYTHFEVKVYDAITPESWSEYHDWNSVYAYVPVELINEFIALHGGIDIAKTFTKALGFPVKV